MSRHIRHEGTERNWEVVGLTADNHVQLRDTDTDGVRDSGESPSEYWGVTYLTKPERGILRRGLTQAGYDRATPRRT